MKKVIVGLSGGVDSSVSAYLLKKQGYDVTALFMKNWDDDNCPAENDFLDVIRVCKQLDIPYYTINFTQEYYDRVFSKCLDDFKKGLTPNPDILCNNEIKFKLFLEKALTLGADYLATGHYCQNLCKNNKNYLSKGLDPLKDQSYFLYGIKSSILDKIIFPIGHLTKKKVRQIAKDNNLANYDKKDSTGICFIGKRKFREFLNTFLPFTPGNFENLNGKVLGEHQGCSFYTLGQRKGLGIGGEGDAWYVVSKDVEKNVVIIAQGKDHPSLFSDRLIASNIHWITDEPKLPLHCFCKIRYRQKDVKCLVEQENNKLKITFEIPQRAITPGQSVVFYDNNICLGGAIIL